MIAAELLLEEVTLLWVRRKAWQLVGKAGFRKSDRQDIEQEFFVALLERLSEYDPLKLPWEPFVKLVVKQKIAQMFRHARAAKRDYRRCRRMSEMTDEKVARRLKCSLTDKKNKSLLEYALADEIDAAEVRRHWLEQDIAVVLADMPKNFRQLCEQLMEKTPKEIAGGDPAAAAALEEAIARIRPYFEQAGLYHYL